MGQGLDIIHPSINNSLNLEIEKKYKQLDLKINRLVATQTEKTNTKTQFYPRVINKTDVTFTDEEMTLLNKGVKYNLKYRNNHRLSTLALEAETAIPLLPYHEQEYLRYQVAHKFQKLYKQQNSKHTAKYFKNESKIFIQIRKELTAAKAIVTKADKGNSLKILPETDCNNKVQTFIANNNFTLVPHDTTKRLQRVVRTAINECKDTIPKETKWRHVSLNPTTPKIRGLIKIHKKDSPIRPVVN